MVTVVNSTKSEAKPTVEAANVEKPKPTAVPARAERVDLRVAVPRSARGAPSGREALARA